MLLGGSIGNGSTSCCKFANCFFLAPPATVSPCSQPHSLSLCLSLLLNANLGSSWLFMCMWVWALPQCATTTSTHPHQHTLSHAHLALRWSGVSPFAYTDKKNRVFWRNINSIIPWSHIFLLLILGFSFRSP